MTRDSRSRSAHDDHDLIFGNRRYTETLAGSMGAADLDKQKPQLLGPDGEPISSKQPVPFGFTK